MKKQLLSSVLAVGTLAIGCLGQMSSAEALTLAGTYGFENITANDPSESVGDGIVNQFKLEVFEVSTNLVQFVLINTGSTASFVGDFYVDQNDASPILSSPNLNSGAGFNSVGNVNFKVPNGNLNFPQGNKIGFDEDFGYTADKPGSGKQGIDAGEKFGIRFNTTSIADVIAALNTGTLRFGLHVQGIASSGGSDSFVSSLPSTPPNPIPTPALLPGLIGMGAAALRKKKREDGTEEVTQEA